MLKRPWYIGVAFVIALAVGGIAVSEEQPIDSQPEPRNEETGQSDTQPFAVPVRIIEEDNQPRRSDKIQQESSQREKEDLIAQQGMNKATQDMVWWSKWQTIFIFVGTIALIVTLWFTRKATNILSDEFVAAHPPKVKLSQFFINPNGIDERDDEIAENFITNTGGNDATITRRTIVFAIDEIPLRRPFKDFNVGSLNIPLKAGKSDWWIVTRSETNLTPEIEEVLLAETSERPVYIIGRVVFLDTRDSRHHTVFTRKFDHGKRRFTQHDDHHYKAES